MLRGSQGQDDWRETHGQDATCGIVTLDTEDRPGRTLATGVYQTFPRHEGQTWRAVHLGSGHRWPSETHGKSNIGSQSWRYFQSLNDGLYENILYSIFRSRTKA